MNYSISHGGGHGDAKRGRQNRFLVVSGSEPPDIAGIFPFLFYVIGRRIGAATLRFQINCVISHAKLRFRQRDSAAGGIGKIISLNQSAFSSISCRLLF